MKYLILLALVTIQLVFFLLLGNKPFYDKGEPREALVAIEMSDQHDYILPKRYLNEYATKPPMTHWLMLISSKITQETNEFSARLPSATLSLAVVITLFIFLTKYNLKTATITSFLLLTFIEWHRASLTARVDMTLACFIFFGLLSLFIWENKKLAGFPWASNLFFLAAFLTKGPVAIVIPIIIFTIYLLIYRHNLVNIIKVNLKVFMPVILLGLTWYILAYLHGGSKFLDIVILENFNRFVSSMNTDAGKHSHSIWYLYETLLVGILPWSICLIAKYKKIKINYDNRLLIFSIIVISTFIIFHSMPESKRSVYLLPIYPWLAYVLANFFIYLQENNFPQFKFLFVAVSSLAISLFSLLLLIRMFSFINAEMLLSNYKKIVEVNFYLTSLRGYIPNGTFPVLILVLPLAIILYSSLMFKKISNPNFLYHLIALILAVFLSFHYLVTNTICKDLSANKYAGRLSEILPKHATIYTNEPNAYDLAYYLEKKEIELKPVKESLSAKDLILISKATYDLSANPLTSHKSLVLRSKTPIQKPDHYYELYQ